MLQGLVGGYDSIIFAGYSLGGTAAFCLAKAIPNSRCVCFNPGNLDLLIIGAAPTNPIITGPGTARATVYHIVGDIISSHMSGKFWSMHDDEEAFRLDKRSDIQLPPRRETNEKILHSCRERTARASSELTRIGDAALLYRIKLQVPFGSVAAHATSNFFSTGSYSLMTATQVKYDEELQVG